MRNRANDYQTNPHPDVVAPWALTGACAPLDDAVPGVGLGRIRVAVCGRVAGRPVRTFPGALADCAVPFVECPSPGQCPAGVCTLRDLYECELRG
jgi:hypothetical protein